MTPKPISAAEAAASVPVALPGSGLADLAIKLGLLPDARSVSLLPAALLSPALAPIYGRGPDATPMTERVKR